MPAPRHRQSQLRQRRVALRAALLALEAQGVLGDVGAVPLNVESDLDVDERLNGAQLEHEYDGPLDLEAEPRIGENVAGALAPLHRLCVADWRDARGKQDALSNHDCPRHHGYSIQKVRDLRALSSQDPHLDVLMKDFENAVRDLRQGCSEGRIKTSIQKQVNLLEAIGRAFPGVTGTTLGAICDQVGTWPHEKLKAAMKDLYGFASDYPGIRHGGTPASALRAVDMRDMVAMSILLAGFIPYLSNGLNADVVYRGA